MALLFLAAPAAPARAHGAGEVPLVAGMFLTPNVGSEFSFRGSSVHRVQLLLSWPMQLPIPSRGSPTDGAPHRVVLSPEVTVGRNAEFRGRVGYRWVPRPLFLGAGLSASRTLGVSAAPEVGVRLLQYNDFNVYAVVRADVPLAAGFNGPWAASLSAGFAFW